MSITARKPNAIVKIGEVVVLNNSVTLVHSVDAMPSVTASLQIENRDARNVVTQGSVKMDIARFNQFTRALQERVLNNFQLDPDMQVIMTDGEGTTLRFNGFLGSPAFAIREGNVGLSASAVHAKTVLQAFNARIYLMRRYYGDEAYSDFVATDEGAAAVATDSVARRIKAWISFLMKQAVMVTDKSEEGVFDFLPVHNMNLAVLPYVNEVLDASEDTTEIEGLSNPEFDNRKIMDAISDVLSTSPNFLQSLTHLANIFQFQINHDAAGNLWLEQIQTLDDPGGRIIQTPHENVAFSLTSKFEMPITQVFVMSAGSELYSYSDIGSNIGAAPVAPVLMDSGVRDNLSILQESEYGFYLSSVARYPKSIEKNARGTFYVLQAPNWVNAESVTLQDRLTVVDRVPNRFTTAPTKVDDQVKTMAAHEDARQKVLDYLAERTYKTLYLDTATANVSIPLNLKVLPGRTYNVVSMNGAQVFSGFLVSATHQIGVENRFGLARTDMRFSHVRAANARIDGLDGVVTAATVDPGT